MSVRGYFYTGSLVGVAVGLYLIRLWQPEQQVSKHSEHLVAALTDKNWSRFGAFIADDYHDQWGHDRAAVLERTREIFRYLGNVEVEAVDPTVSIAAGQGHWRARIIVKGKENNELVAAMKERVNSLQSAFELEWRHVSGKPWDWKLVAVRNQELVLPAEY